MMTRCLFEEVVLKKQIKDQIFAAAIAIQWIDSRKRGLGLGDKDVDTMIDDALAISEWVAERYDSVKDGAKDG